MRQYIFDLLNGVLEGWRTEGRFPKELYYELNEYIKLPDLSHGDFFTNLAMNLASRLKQNPNVIAAEMAELLVIADQQKEKNFSAITAAGGFINFTLSSEVIAHSMSQLKQGIFFNDPATQIGKDKKVVFEYSSPNTNKPLHIGHFRNDVYGKACINLLKAVGYDVTSCEIINDRGIHIMKSVLMYQKFGNNQTPEEAKMKTDHFVGHFYKMFSEKAAESEAVEKALLEEAQGLLQRWENGEAEVREIWKKMNEWFFEGVKQTYEKEGTTFDEVDFESEIYNKGRDIVMAGVEKGVFQKEEDSSVSITFSEEHLGKKYLLRRDGTTIYITQDMYLWDERNKKHHPDMAFVTTATEQAYHFEVLGKIFALLEYPWAPNFKHLPYEHVYLGKDKMSSRSGNSISSDELLENVKEKVRQTMAGLERLKGSVDDDKLVEAVAFGAIKYGYLHYEPQTRIYFDIDQTIALEGNTGPYIQYAYARIYSIMAKVGELAPKDVTNLNSEPELALMRMLMRYEAAVVLAATEYKPNLLCNYLYDLASTFNTFYNNVPVIKEQDLSIRSQRLSLLHACANVLQNGLSLLGIEAPEQM
jgi:arginyl-tRNA synthetase